MTIDQRIEALTQSVELMAHMLRDAEAAAEKRDLAADKRDAVTDKRFSQIAQILETTHDSILRLERIAMAHEQRLDHVEKQQ